MLDESGLSHPTRSHKSDIAFIMKGWDHLFGLLLTVTKILRTFVTIDDKRVVQCSHICYYVIVVA